LPGGSNGFYFGTQAQGVPATVGRVAHRGSAVGLAASDQVAAAVGWLGPAIASLPPMEPDTEAEERASGMSLIPGLSSPAFGTSTLGANSLGANDLGANNLAGAPVPLDAGGPNATGVVALPGSLFTSPGSPVNIIDAVSDGGAALDWNIGNFPTSGGIAFDATELAAVGGVTTGISAIEAADVPEPASLLLLGGGLFAAVTKRRNARRRLRVG